MGGVRVLLSLVCGLVLFLSVGVRTTEAGPPGRELPPWVDVPSQVYFPETGHHLAEPFLFYWRMNGGRAVFGLPIAEAQIGAPGQPWVQYFERAVLEYRADAGGATTLVVGQGAMTSSSVNLRTGPGTSYGKVGVLTREARVRLVGGPLPDAEGAPWFQIAGPFGTGWSKGEFLERRDEAISVTTPVTVIAQARASEAPFRPLAPLVIGALGPDTDDLTLFPTTGHTLSGAFKRYWERYGGAFVFGLPLSEPFNELNPATGQVYLSQYFEYAKLEYHASAAGTAYEVQPATLGRWAASVAKAPTGAVTRNGGAPDYNEADFSGIKWIEVNLSEQRMTAWEGDLPVMTTLIRSGKQGWETPPGAYRIFRKLPTDDMTLGTPGDPDYYYIKDVPWVMYFLEGGYAIHGADWLDVWGTPTSRGCVNTPGEIAAALYEWAPLDTIVWIHR